MTSVQAAVSSVSGDGKAILATSDATTESVTISAITVNSGDALQNNAALVTGAYLYDYLQSSTLSLAGGNASGTSAIAVGANSVASSYYNIAIGDSAVAKHCYGIAIGRGASIVSSSSPYVYNAMASIAIGSGTDSSGLAFYVDLSGATVTGAAAIAIGAGSVSAGESVVIGVLAKGEEHSTVIGTQAGAYSGGVAIGEYAKGTCSGSMAVGNRSSAYANYSLAYGYSARVGYFDSTNTSGIGGIAIGSSIGAFPNPFDVEDKTGAKVLADYGISIGTGTSVSGAKSVALGFGSRVAVENAVALGYGSQATVANTISVGSSSNQRRIMNVATGTADTDAVNVSQLKDYVSTHVGTDST